MNCIYLETKTPIEREQNSKTKNEMKWKNVNISQTHIHTLIFWVIGTQWPKYEHQLLNTAQCEHATQIRN